MRKTIMALLFVFMAVMPLSQVTAQTDTQINYGDTVGNEIRSQSDVVSYVFEGNEGDIVTILVQANDPSQLDLTLTLVNPQNKQIAFNDDNNGVNPIIEEQLLPESGLYTIRVQAVSGQGGFILQLNKIEPNTPTPIVTSTLAPTLTPTPIITSTLAPTFTPTPIVETPQPAQTISPIADGAILFEDDFSDNDADWETANDPGNILSLIENDRMFIEYTYETPGGSWIVAPGFTNRSLAPIFDNNYVIEVELDNLEHEEGYSVGFIWNVQEGYNGFEWIILYSSGLLSYVYDDGEYSTRIDNLYAEPLDLDDGKHRLGLVVDNENYTFLIDDVVIWTFVIEEDYLSSGTVGVSLGQPREVGETTVSGEFDNFTVYELTTATVDFIRESPVCAIVAKSNNTNLREGPGTNFAVGGQIFTEGARLEPSGKIKVIGQTTGTDRYTWWKLANGLWVRNDLVNTIGNCDQIAVVEE